MDLLTGSPRPNVRPARAPGYQRERGRFDIRLPSQPGTGNAGSKFMAPSHGPWVVGFTGRDLRVMGQNPKTEIVVEVIGVVPVTVGAARVPMIVVPGAPTHRSIARPLA